MPQINTSINSTNYLQCKMRPTAQNNGDKSTVPHESVSKVCLIRSSAELASTQHLFSNPVNLASNAPPPPAPHFTMCGATAPLSARASTRHAGQAEGELFFSLMHTLGRRVDWLLASFLKTGSLYSICSWRQSPYLKGT